MNCESLSEINPIDSAISQCSGHRMNDSTGCSSELRTIIHVRGSETFKSDNVIRLMLLGNSECGKSSFVHFMSGNKHKISPFSRTTRSRVKCVNRLFDMIEAPGFQSGAGEGVWRDIVSHSNHLGGVDVFLLLVNPLEEDAIMLYRELNNFEKKYVANRQVFWERAVVVFTHADSKGSTRSEQEKNIQILLHTFKADNLRQIVINADNRCLYVNSLDHTPTYQTVQLQALYNQIDKIQEPFTEDTLLQSVVSMNGSNPMTTFGTNLNRQLDNMNKEFDEFQTFAKKKKKKKKILDLSRVKEITKFRRGSKEVDEELIIEKYNNKSRTRSSFKVVINPLKRILTHNRQGPRDYDRANSDQSTQPTFSRVHECEVSEKLNKSLTLPDIFQLVKDESINENPHSVEVYGQNEESHNLHNNSSEQLVFTVISDGSESDGEEFFTPPQSLSEL